MWNLPVHRLFQFCRMYQWLLTHIKTISEKLEQVGFEQAGLNDKLFGKEQKSWWFLLQCHNESRFHENYHHQTPVMGFYTFNAVEFLPFFWSKCRTHYSWSLFACSLFFCRNFGLFPFRILLLEHLLVILMNYKPQNKKYLGWARHPTPPWSTIRDQPHFSAGPTRRLFRKIRRIEFPHLDRRKARSLGGPHTLRKVFLPSQTMLHRSHEWSQDRRPNHTKDSDHLFER